MNLTNINTYVQHSCWRSAQDCVWEFVRDSAHFSVANSVWGSIYRPAHRSIWDCVRYSAPYLIKKAL